MQHPIYLFATMAMLHSGFARAETPAFIPQPTKVEIHEGRYQLDASTSIVAPASLTNEATLLATRLRATAGIPAEIIASGNGITLAIDSQLEPEGYTLEIKPDGVIIHGGSNAGVFYGTQTYLQTLPPVVLGREPAPDADWSSPVMRVVDSPATNWRGLHLDSARHFQPKGFILKFIDAMAAQKLNRLHWHLLDSEGWRLEIRKYPKLTEVAKDTPASYPEEIPTNPTVHAKFKYGHFHGGDFYTQDEVREIVNYAARRHITIVPEIEFPGHAMVALTAYPEIGTSGKVPTARSNISPDLIGVHPTAIAFIRNVLDETMTLFPGPWIHFGGDEAPKGQWQNDTYTQKRIDELGLRVNDPKNPHASEDALQAWLFNEMAAHVAKKGRKAVGWEEIMHGDNINHLAKGSVIMPWLSAGNGAKAANAGYGVVHTAVGPFYLDSYQVKDAGEPTALYQGPFTVENIYQFELFPAGLTPEGRKNILGAQGQLWTELMPRTDDVEYQAFPRACAIAELTWTAPDLRKDTADFMARLAEHGARLTALGLNHRRMAPPAGLKWSPEFLSAAKKWEIPLPVSQIKGSSLELGFRYGSGAHGLDITAVELLADGAVVAEDRHPGFTGTSPKNPTYTLTIPQAARSKVLSLRISAKGSGGNDSRGEITISSHN